jgi:hypothetical protein
MLVIEDQKADLAVLLPANQKLVLGSYLDLRMSERNWFLPVAIFQAVFRSRLLLTVVRSHKCLTTFILGPTNIFP